jgi:hypothetical protein
VTRRKGETLSGRYRRNGYVLSHKIPIGPQDAFAGKPGSYSKSETLSGRYRSNGYVLSHKISIGRLDAFAGKPDSYSKGDPHYLTVRLACHPTHHSYDFSAQRTGFYEHF